MLWSMERVGCRYWNGQFSGFLGIDIEYVKPNEFDKLSNLIATWEVLRLISRSDEDTKEVFRFLSGIILLD
ncbi:hypothetical protein TpMuguga_04g00123 [Theileria parva strain Muguga]|uniref:Uncharacterized protein n=1 Tax=Theileria parva TaxID=5875 RepID=Q4N364_THEPA|nr:uncharacterized protein TpMuguga_04g00123 [Theileria parva strain Muguga]EAN31475.1 hypothetical protein TpMuguga_04g00123 [Theileria parva strain Muguga]|eukprot:XP_763758.1 hypothetical protein [Theileria parva strain Muguga]